MGEGVLPEVARRAIPVLMVGWNVVGVQLVALRLTAGVWGDRRSVGPVQRRCLEC